ncbi:hypothetical protein [Sphaerisporangium fuscum]|uniref:hypothetical protein n=1 Tax=Sphaerisporangium fuscum TaxID=2835868 RepID=UPI001BDC53ED|nr:hypothetical protein [Sphaerisporangium fuscum]
METEPEERTPESLLLALEADDISRILQNLVWVTLGGYDRRWVQDKCLELCDHPDLQVRQLAITCLGHLARMYATLDLDRVLPKLRALKHLPGTRGVVENTFSDISIFIYRAIPNVTDRPDEPEPNSRPSQG